MSGFAQFRHLTAFRIERRNGAAYRNTPTSTRIGHHKQPCLLAHCYRPECGVWFVVSADGSREWGPYKTFRNAWNRRKAEAYGTNYRNARGMPS